ncbi:FkbM family methyltransferase [Novispirillum sp. DQ9]|uniref:FkbM family methyltransferase n=1 Tax=Novispirillum sp. DQ9 TaxID=3398612 RepID=UPI003C7B3123
MTTPSDLSATEALDRWVADNGEEKRLDYPLTANSVVFDIGGHVGDWAADIADRYDCYIHIFEVVAEHAREARQRFATNPKVQVHNFGLSSTDSCVTIHLAGTGSSAFRSEGPTEQCQLREIGAVMAELGTTLVDLCKINIEGAEFALLDHILDNGLAPAFKDLQIQFHDVSPTSAAHRQAIRRRLQSTHVVTYDYPFVWENWRRHVAISAGYQIIDRAEALAQRGSSWAHRDVALAQEEAFAGLLAAMRANRPRTDLVVAAQAVQASSLHGPSVLEVGCGSGYMADALEHLGGGPVNYRGADSSVAMIDLAREKRPQHEFLIASATALPFHDDDVDIVFNGVSLMHTMDYPLAIAEAARVARHFCIFHTVPVLEKRPTTYLRKFAYGRPTTEVIVNEGELKELFAVCGLRLVQTWNSIPYDLSFILGEPTPTRTYLCAVDKTVAQDHPRLVNVGCGRHYHPAWINMDVAPSDASVIRHDIQTPLPLEDESCDAVYHSHVLEHLPRRHALAFLTECFRVVRPGGMLRVAVPDLEQICRAYLASLRGALRGGSEALARHEWMTIELLDQMVRDQSGGEMYRYWMQDPMPAEDFVYQRVGEEAREAISRARAGGAGKVPPPFSAASSPSPADAATFRQSGEVHLWMYDRVSLLRLLEEAGFICARIRRASQSAIAGFASCGLETMPDGAVRKPDSLFMEAFRPSRPTLSR